MDNDIKDKQEILPAPLPVQRKLSPKDSPKLDQDNDEKIVMNALVTNLKILFIYLFAVPKIIYLFKNLIKKY